MVNSQARCDNTTSDKRSATPTPSQEVVHQPPLLHPRRWCISLPYSIPGGGASASPTPFQEVVHQPPLLHPRRWCISHPYSIPGGGASATPTPSQEVVHQPPLLHPRRWCISLRLKTLVDAIIGCAIFISFSCTLTSVRGLENMAYSVYLTQRYGNSLHPCASQRRYL